MLQTRHELLERFRNPEFVPHPSIEGVNTFAFLHPWRGGPVVVGLPGLVLTVNALDYLRCDAAAAGSPPQRPLRFQPERYRLWYQVEGTGILQNLGRNAFGRATPGLLGVMDLGERHTYLHQKGPFECFTMDFALEPAASSHCYWNAEIEGKRVLAGEEQLFFENQAFTLLRLFANAEELHGMASAARLADIAAVLFGKGLLVIQDEHFPRNKARSLVAKARAFMDTHYHELSHQRLLRKACGVDINYLNILFRREAGITLYKYLTRVRMEHAKHLLEEGREPVVGIAAAVGYPNCNSFTRAFRKSVGVAPSAYRDKQRRLQV
jgi:AraC-like DNA-binding protein